MVRRAKKIDGNHGVIRDGLRARGFDVLDLSAVGGGVPDLCVMIAAHRSLFLEVKRQGIKNPEAALTPEQRRWSLYNGAITRIVQDLEEAVRECEMARDQEAKGHGWSITASKGNT